MPGLNEIAKTSAFKGLTKYLDYIKDVRPDEYQRIMSKPDADGLADLRNSLDTQIKDLKVRVDHGSYSSILPNWLPDAVRPAQDIQGRSELQKQTGFYKGCPQEPCWL